MLGVAELEKGARLRWRSRALSQDTALECVSTPGKSCLKSLPAPATSRSLPTESFVTLALATLGVCEAVRLALRSPSSLLNVHGT